MYRFTTTLSIIATLSGGLALAGCSRGPSSADGASGNQPSHNGQSSAPQIINSVITTVSQTDGQTLVEIPLGRDHGISPGTLLRVIDQNQEGYLKGMLQVLTVAEAELSLARQIGLLDRQNPIAVGDPVVVINDVRELGGNDGPSLSERLQQAGEDADQESAEQQEQFSELRKNFRNELQKLQEQHDAQLKQMEGLHRQHIETMEADFARRLQRQEAQHRTELSAVRESLADEALSELRRDRDARSAEIQRLTAENAKLLQQVESFAGGLEVASESQRRHEAAIADLRRAHQREILAEIETREILEQRIRELEVRLGLPGSRAPAVLVGDVGREETVLARLDRITRQRNELLRENEQLRGQLTGVIGSTQGDDSAGSAESIVEIRLKNQQLSEDLERSNVRLEALRERLSGMELARLQAERNFFDLAAQLLRLPGNSPSLQMLQEELRTQLNDLAAPPADPESQSEEGDSP